MLNIFVKEIKINHNKYGYLLLKDDYTIVKPVKKYLKYKATINKKNTVKSYAYSLKYFFEFLNKENKNFSQLSYKKEDMLFLINRFVQFLKHPHIIDDTVYYFDVSKEDSEKKPSTINTILSALFDFLKYYFDMSGLYENKDNIPTNSFLSELIKLKTKKRLVDYKRTSAENIKYIKRNTYTELIDNCNLYRDKLLISILFEGGLRIGEALGLRWEDINFQNRTIKVKSREYNENDAYVKYNAEGTVFLLKPEIVYKYLELYLTKEFMPLNKETDYVFVNLFGKNKGHALKYNTVIDLFHRLSKKINKKVTPHMLRHGHGTELYKITKEVKYVKKQLRHVFTQTSYKYVGVDDSDIRKAIQEKTKGGNYYL